VDWIDDDSHRHDNLIYIILKHSESIRYNKQPIWRNNMTKENELTIDINQYIQYDEDGDNVIHFNEAEFINDARLYLEQDNSDYKIK